MPQNIIMLTIKRYFIEKISFKLKTDPYFILFVVI